MNPFCSPLVNKLIDLALEEDLAYGDVTAELLKDNSQRSAQILAREDLVVCGLPITERIISRASFSISVESRVKEGTKASNGTVLQVLKGAASELTSIERTILNFLQRLCGVATYTRSIVDQAAGISVLDTRKTMPGFRLLDKYSTVVGGAKNHRMHLGEMILIKNNHIDSASGNTIQEKVRQMLGRLKHRKGYYVPCQVEVRSEQELEAVPEFCPEAVLLDNMDDKLISKCISHIKARSPKTLCEVSGGIDAARLKSLAALGVNAASMGRLTTRAPNVDISMKIQG